MATTVDEGVMKGESLDVLMARPIVQKKHVYFTVTKKESLSYTYSQLTCELF